MFVGVVFQKQSNAVNAVETVSGCYLGDTIEEAGGFAETAAEGSRKAAGSSYRYRVMAGELTHLVNPPSSNVTLIPIKK